MDFIKFILVLVLCVPIVYFSLYFFRQVDWGSSGPKYLYGADKETGAETAQLQF